MTRAACRVKVNEVVTLATTFQRLGRLRSNSLCVLGVISVGLCKSQLWCSRTCTPLHCISGTAGQIALKYGVRLGTCQIRMFHKLRKRCSARVHVHTRPLYLLTTTCIFCACSFIADNGVLLVPTYYERQAAWDPTFRG